MKSDGQRLIENAMYKLMVDNNICNITFKKHKGYGCKYLDCWINNLTFKIKYRGISYEYNNKVFTYKWGNWDMESLSIYSDGKELYCQDGYPVSSSYGHKDKNIKLYNRLAKMVIEKRHDQLKKKYKQ